MDDDLLLHSYCLSIYQFMMCIINQSRGSGWLGGSAELEPSSPARHAPLTIITLGHNYLYDNLLPVINNLQGINLFSTLAHRNHCHTAGGKIIRAPAPECIFSPRRKHQMRATTQKCRFLIVNSVFKRAKVKLIFGLGETQKLRFNTRV